MQREAIETEQNNDAREMMLPSTVGLAKTHLGRIQYPFAFGNP